MSSVTGVPQHWARDFALIGSITALVAPGLAVSFDVPVLYALVASATGAVTGGLLGAAMPGLLDRVRGRIPLTLLLLGLGPLLGALWGGVVGAVAFWATGAHSLLLSIAVAATAGAAQLGLTWFPYTFQVVRGGRVWPVVLGACLLSPLIGLLSIFSAILYATMTPIL